MKLEGIDPQHPSMYFILTVAEVCGYRMRLHFDGYSECHDFWLNADSPDIHPAGWFEETGHKLQPPKGYKEEEFSWTNYLKLTKAQAAPKHLFMVRNTVSSSISFLPEPACSGVTFPLQLSKMLPQALGFALFTPHLSSPQCSRARSMWHTLVLRMCSLDTHLICPELVLV